MKTNSVKHKLLSGGTSLGTFVFEFATTGIARLAAGAGAEFAVFDMEHTGYSVETVRMLVATSRATELVPLVRVPATEYHFIARVLDVGAAGIMVPMVETADQARTIVKFSKYPPVGRRGAAFGVAHDDYGPGDIVEKMQSANRETIVIAQIETAAGVENCEAIAAVDGVDCLWIGHFDLTNSLGIPGQFEHPTFRKAVDRVLAACRTSSKIPAFMAGDVAAGRELLAQGFRMIAYGADMRIYQAALSQGIAELKSMVGR